MSPIFSKKKPAEPRGDDPAVAGKLGLLRASDLFHGLTDEQMDGIDRMTVLTRYSRGKLIYGPGDHTEVLFLLKKGQVRLYRITPEGKKLITAVITPGTLFGNMGFTGSRLLDSYAEASENSVLCVMSRHDLEELVLRHPSVGLRLVGTLSSRVEELESRLEEALLRDMNARVAAALLRLMDQQGTAEVAVTHQELADSIGTYRETVTATLGDMQDRGVVRLHRGRIEVLDPATLQALVAPVD
jgi:CRP/FNR family transcriptional regulator, cyclic AMP receptor protein